MHVPPVVDKLQRLEYIDEPLKTGKNTVEADPLLFAEEKFD